MKITQIAKIAVIARAHGFKWLAEFAGVLENGSSSWHVFPVDFTIEIGKLKTSVYRQGRGFPGQFIDWDSTAWIQDSRILFNQCSGALLIKTRRAKRKGFKYLVFRHLKPGTSAGHHGVLPAIGTDCQVGIGEIKIHITSKLASSW